MDAVSLTQQLIRFPSITPQGALCLDFIESFLKKRGFTCHRLIYGEVHNLYARLGESRPNFCFAGHVDVVPEGDLSRWRFPPFDGIISEGILYGRGVVDMKGAIGAFLQAVSVFIQSPFHGSLSLLLTSDEEGIAVNGTRHVIKWLEKGHEKIDACLVGEPTNPHHVGEMVKIGRRGSLNIDIRVEGVSGHVAYPPLAKNPIPILLSFLQEICSLSLDKGTKEFPPSHIEITSIDVGNVTRNLIPSIAHARVNIRFNPLQSERILVDRLTQIASQFPLKIHILPLPGAEAFMSKNMPLIQILNQAIGDICGFLPTLSTTGGTSDARFIKDICPVIEFGLVNKTAHHINECIPISEITKLSIIYEKILHCYFQR